VVTEDLRQHPGLLEQLEHARRLGLLGPGPVEPHIEHAGAFATALEGVHGTVVDLGSGGGVPGLVLALARPDLHLVLLDARGTRCRFLEGAVEALGLHAEVVEGRAEDIGRSERRGAAGAVVARSFGIPAATAECAAPLLEVGGLLVVSEPPPPPQPDRWPARGLAELGLDATVRVGSGPTVQVLVQRTECPAAYPRRDGVPTKQPLF
jgi:16S rRNA (guanine527-N7)-methyltransferase